MTSMLHRKDLTKKRVCHLVYHQIGSVLGDAKFATRIVRNEAKWMISKAQKDEDPSEIVKACFLLQAVVRVKRLAFNSIYCSPPISSMVRREAIPACIDANQGIK
jgi:hypothetical protein